MRIGIDARLYGVASGTGIGRYVEELLRALAETPNDLVDVPLEFVVFLRRDGFDAFDPPDAHWTKVLADVRPYTWGVHTILPRLLRDAHLDLVHFTHFDHPLRCSVPFVVTIHDLILLEHPSIRASTLGPVRFWTKYVGYRAVLRHAATASQRILTPSVATASALRDRLGISTHHITVTPLGVDHSTRSQISDAHDADLHSTYAVQARFRIPDAPYLLYVGNCYPHKHLAQLLRIFPHLRTRHPDLHLVLVGRKDDFSARLQVGIDRTPIVFTGALSDTDVHALLARALAYVSPSQCEGFDLPTLEAAAIGIPVIASDIPVHREVLGDAALFVPVDDDRALIDAIHRLAIDADLRGILGARGRARAHAFTWRTCAQRTLVTYRACRRVHLHPHAAVHHDAVR